MRLKPNLLSLLNRNMTSLTDNLKVYESAIFALSKEPDILLHKHTAVLALARAGSLDFALSEYMRLGLNRVRHHEDIMSLHGRLYKDLYLSHQGKKAIELARLSAEKYENAYKDSGGFYSGINAASMALLGGVPCEMVEMRARRLLKALPVIEDVDREVYFIEASRAEAYFLLGEMDKAYASLKNAINFDPLNFTAHASTLKQLAMITKARNIDVKWLSEFSPPRAIHFAGHIFGREGEVEEVPVLSEDTINHIAQRVTELIQVNDIGFGFGALAAGSDIVIAECLLEEGGELHVVLPVDRARFSAASIKPYGASWQKRFESCLENASSITEWDGLKQWPDHMLQDRASLMAMGGAIRHSEALAVNAGQLVIWDKKKGKHGTAYDAQLWQESERPQYILPYTWIRNAQSHGAQASKYKYQTLLTRPGMDEPLEFDTLIDGIKAALDFRQETPRIMQALSLRLQGDPIAEPPTSINLFAELPGTICVNELAANYISLHHNRDFSVSFMGLSQQNLRVFALQERG